MQIKRPDPHFPEGHNENDPNHNPEEAAGLLISEPACCPYCTQPEFGVTYDPPPFRRGLTYAVSPLAAGSTNTAMSSSSSLNSANLSPGGGGRRRGQSLSANNSSVILTDKIRPEWAAKLQAARSHQARRAAAATALHTAAFLIGNGENNRAFRSRFSRRNTGGSGSATASPNTGNNGEGDNGDSGSATPSQGVSTQDGSRLAAIPGGSQRAPRVEEIEEMMFLEAVRMSIASEEERKRKAEKEEQKEAKKREKEERKAAKAAAKHRGPYESSGGRSGHSSASASALSLPGLGFGRKRGNSAASNLRIEASATDAVTPSSVSGTAGADANSKEKGKAVDRGQAGVSEAVADSTASRSPSVTSTSNPRPIPSPHPPAGPSHLRQMSSASSVASSILDSRQDSFTSPSNIQDPHGSGLSLGSEDDGDQEGDRDPSASTEPLLNFRSLAEVVGVSLDGETAGKRLSQVEADKDANQTREETKDGAEKYSDHATDKQVELVAVGGPEAQGSEDKTTSERAEVASSPEALAPPKVMVTPDTPDVNASSDAKQLGYETTTVERTHQVSQ